MGHARCCRDAVTLEHLDRAVVHCHRDRDDDGLLALLQDVHQALVDLEDVGHAAQLARAIWKGFSRRWDSGASTVVTWGRSLDGNALSIGRYLIVNPIVRVVGGPFAGRCGHEPDPIAARIEQDGRQGRVR